MDLMTYALCKKMVSSATSGISEITSTEKGMSIKTNDGQTFDIDFPKSESISVVGVSIENGRLICTMSDGSTVDAGEVTTTDSNEYTSKTDIDDLFKEDVNETYTTEEDIDDLFND